MRQRRQGELREISLWVVSSWQRLFSLKNRTISKVHPQASSNTRWQRVGS